MAVKQLLAYYSGIAKQLQAGDTFSAPMAVQNVRSFTNGEAGPVVIGTPLYISASDTGKKAKADALGTSDVAGLVKDASVASAGTGTCVLDGVLTATTGQWDAVTGQTGGLTPGADYYLDFTTAGKMTTTPPADSDTGKFCIKLGTAWTTTDFEVDTGTIIGL